MPFPLYGLSDDFTGPRSVNGIGVRHDTINHVALAHGSSPRDASGPWVQVTVTGPLQQGSWSLDPLPAIAAELLNVAGLEFVSTKALEDAEQSLLAGEWSGVELVVDGAPTQCRLLRAYNCWMALHQMLPAHLLYVLARGVEPSDIALERITDLRAYTAGTRGVR